MLQTRDLIWALLFFGYAASLQVQIMPNQGEISVGESKFFMCEVVGDAKEISWFGPRGDKILAGRPDITVTMMDESASTLTIYNANVDNAGIYKCIASADGEQDAEASVNVKIFQRITFENVPSPQEFNEGDDATIVCDVVSSPPATIIWKYRNKAIQMEKDVRFKLLANNHLSIRGIKKTDEGMYTCEARIMARGEVDLKLIQVVINVLPSIRTRQSELNATADIGKSATLACDADGFPEPTVTWARDGVLLEESEKYSFQDEGSELVINDVKKVDEGDYSCIATNKAGRKQEDVSLNVFVQPKITFLENQSATEFDPQVMLTCEATGDPTPSIVWSFGRRVFEEGDQSLDGNVVVRSDARVSSLTLKYVQFTDAGQYVCTASNVIGQDLKSMFLEVSYAPKIQGPVAVYSWPGNPVNITCEVVAHPVASVVWYSDGQPLPSPNNTHIKIFNTPAASYLEVVPSETDFGSYNCTASNGMGRESKEFLLIEADLPSMPSIERVEPYSSTMVVEFDEPDSSGGVPVLRYRAEWRAGGAEWISEEYTVDEISGLNQITIQGLKPDTVYELRLTAINGKGAGESSPVETFKTQTVREPNPPKLDEKVTKKGDSVKVYWIKQDDGGSPITHYLVRYKSKSGEWRPEIRMPRSSEYVLLNGLEWDTEYEIYVVAQNLQGKSEASFMTFRTLPEPTTVPGGEGTVAESSGGLGTGAIVGILVVVFLLLLAGVDVTCYFLNHCGLLKCIEDNLCGGGKGGAGGKAKDLEEGKAAFTSKDESKEPIVEVRTEEERTPNHEGGGSPEPNETTPLTDPDGKTVTAEDKSKVEETKTADPKATSPSEVTAIPNEAPQANGNESKA
ncbi:neural cell adhesion molecule 1-like [Engraulis encrasicolus]|uniref:neural cell adhesion molecule 1-like n=1 Tax=Engraulis encrasicolus TaxID=184585 RepID=UPI002FD0BD28